MVEIVKWNCKCGVVKRLDKTKNAVATIDKQGKAIKIQCATYVVSIRGEPLHELRKFINEALDDQ